MSDPVAFGGFCPPLGTLSPRSPDRDRLCVQLPGLSMRDSTGRGRVISTPEFVTVRPNFRVRRVGWHPGGGGENAPVRVVCDSLPSAKNQPYATPLSGFVGAIGVPLRSKLNALRDPSVSVLIVSLVHMERRFVHTPIRTPPLENSCRRCEKESAVLFLIPFKGLFCRLCRRVVLGLEEG